MTDEMESDTPLGNVVDAAKDVSRNTDVPSSVEVIQQDRSAVALAESTPAPPTGMAEAGNDLVRELVISAEQCRVEIDLLRIENNEISLSYQAQIRELTAEQLSLRSVNATLATNTASADELARLRADEAKKANDAIASLQTKLAELKRRFDLLEFEKASAEDVVVRRDRKAADDAVTIQQLRAQIADFAQLKLASEARIVNESAFNMRLVRDSKESQADAKLRDNRNEFLEAERTRLSRELAEARSQSEVSNETHSAALRSANARIAELSNDVATTNVRAKQSADEVVRLERQLADIQSERERARSDSLRETTKLSKLVEMHREATKDAEMKVVEYKELLATMAFDKKAEEARPRPTGKLDQHAEVVLKNMQAALAARADDLQQQREELNKARQTETKIAVKYEQLAREAEQTRQEGNQAKSKIGLLEKELEERNRKIATLERRFMLAGDSPSIGTPSSRRQTLESGIPDAGFGSQVIPMQLGGPVIDSPALKGMESSFEEMESLRLRHERILFALRDQKQAAMKGLMTD